MDCLHVLLNGVELVHIHQLVDVSKATSLSHYPKLSFAIDCCGFSVSDIDGDLSGS